MKLWYNCKQELREKRIHIGEMVMTWNTLEELQALIREDNRVTTPKGLYEEIKGSLSYSLEYAEDRVQRLKDSMDEQLYADCLSTDKFRQQQIKRTTDALSEESNTYTNHLDRLADYILFCSFDNAADRHRTEQLKQEKKALQKIKDMGEREKRLIANRDAQTTRPSLLAIKRDTGSRIESVSLHIGNLEDEFYSERRSSLVHYTRVDKELNQRGSFKNNLRYWMHFGQHNSKISRSIFDVDYSVPYFMIAYEALNQRNEAISVVLAKILEETHPQRKIELNRLKRDMTEEYNFVAEQLRSPTVLSGSTPAKSTDALTLVEERVDYTNKQIVKAIVYGFADFKQNYIHNTAALHWDIVQDFDAGFKQLKLGAIQKTVAQAVVNTANWNYKDIIDEVKREHHKVLDRSTVAYHINHFINKLLQYFIEQSLKTEESQTNRGC